MNFAIKNTQNIDLPLENPKLLEQISNKIQTRKYSYETLSKIPITIYYKNFINVYMEDLVRNALSAKSYKLGCVY